MNTQKDCPHQRTYSGFNHADAGRIAFTQCRDCLKTWPDMVPRVLADVPSSKD